MKNAPNTTVEGILAEGTRFELVVQNNPYGSLANCWFQPLTHPSGLKAFETPAVKRDCKDTNFYSKRKFLKNNL